MIAPLAAALAAPLYAASPDKAAFDYSACLFGQPKTLHVGAVNINRNNGTVECYGDDSAQPQQPFAWDWGDGEKSAGFFPQTHSYRNCHTNYIVKVTARYPDGRSDTEEILVRFCPLPPPRAHMRLPDDIRVVIPSEMPHLRPVRAPYGVASNLTVFTDSFLMACPRKNIEQVLTAAAAIQMDFANNDVCKTNGRFEQVLLQDPDFSGMSSLWYTDPPCLAVGDYGFKNDIAWSSLFHEMGHNITLNSPARYYWGFKIDGPANTIYSETMAQIFQHATACELLNNPDKYGISPDLACDIARSARASMCGLRRSYEDYQKNGCMFCSWNDGKTKDDDTFNTFMTIAYKFFEHAEKDRCGYQQPVKRLMAFLQRFNPKWEKSFSASNNSKQAEQFRATLMSAALSYAFKKDLREEFCRLRFPIDDKAFRELTASSAIEKGQPAGSARGE